MRLTMKEKKKLGAILAPKYQKAGKKEKGQILNQYVDATHYGRCYAAYVLRSHGKKVWVDTRRVVVSDIRKQASRKKERIYDDAVASALKEVWSIMDYICGKRLSPILNELIPRLIRFGEIRVTPAVKDKLMKISSSTIDRLLASERKKQAIKGRSNTKPGTLLKSQIPIRTFSEWDNKKPGFVEIDLVGMTEETARGNGHIWRDGGKILKKWIEWNRIIKN